MLSCSGTELPLLDILLECSEALDDTNIDEEADNNGQGESEGLNRVLLDVVTDLSHNSGELGGSNGEILLTDVEHHEDRLGVESDLSELISHCDYQLFKMNYNLS